MDIPIELFALFIGSSIALAIIGLIRNPQIPVMITFSGILIVFTAIMTDTINMDFVVTDNSQLEYFYNVDSRSFERSIVNNTALIIAESVDGTSGQLIDDVINCVDVQIRKTGSPNLAYPVQIGVWDTNGALKHLFGSLNVTSISTSADWYKSCTYENSYTIVANDRIGIKHIGSSAGNQIVVELDANNPFDSTVTIHQEYNAGTNTWTSFTANDLTARFYYEVLDSPITSTADYEFTELPKTIFALFGVVMMLTGTIMVFKDE